MPLSSTYTKSSLEYEAIYSKNALRFPSSRSLYRLAFFRVILSFLRAKHTDGMLALKRLLNNNVLR